MDIVVVYNPPGEEPRQWQFDPFGWTVGESKLIEAESKLLMQDFFDQVAAGSITHQVLAWWVIRRREEPDLRIGDLDEAKASYLNFYGVVQVDEAEGKAEDPEGSDSSDASPTSSSTT